MIVSHKSACLFFIRHTEELGFMMLTFIVVVFANQIVDKRNYINDGDE